MSQIAYLATLSRVTAKLRVGSRVLLGGALLAGSLTACGSLQPNSGASLRQARMQVSAQMLDMIATAGPGTVTFAGPYLDDNQCTNADGDSSAPNGRFAPSQQADIYMLSGTVGPVIRRIEDRWRSHRFVSSDGDIFQLLTMQPDAAASDGDYSVGLVRNDSNRVSVAAISSCVNVGNNARPFQPPAPGPTTASLARQVRSVAGRVERALAPGGVQLIDPQTEPNLGTPLSNEDPNRDEQTVGEDGLYAVPCPGQTPGRGQDAGVAFQATFAVPGNPVTADGSAAVVTKPFTGLVAAWRAAGPTIWEPAEATAVTRLGGLGVQVTEMAEQIGETNSDSAIAAYQLDISADCPALSLSALGTRRGG